MRLWISVGQKREEELRQGSALAPFLAEWEARGHDWSCLTAGGGADPWHRIRDGQILLTDDEGLAAGAKERGTVTFGLGRGSFPGAEAVFEKPEALTVCLLEMLVCHARGVPYTIGCLEGVSLRESLPEDFDRLYQIFEESGLPMFSLQDARGKASAPEGKGIFGEKSREDPEDSGQADRGEAERAGNFDEDFRRGWQWLWCDEEAGWGEAKAPGRPQGAAPKDKLRAQTRDGAKTWDELFGSDTRRRKPMRRTIRLDHQKIRTRDAFEHYVKCQYQFYGFGIWTILAEGGRVAGWCGFGTRKGVPDLGYIVEKRLRGRGIARKACQIALDFARKELELDRVELYVQADNAVSIHLAEKLGFCRRGVCEEGLAYELELGGMAGT